MDLFNLVSIQLWQGKDNKGSLTLIYQTDYHLNYLISKLMFLGSQMFLIKAKL